MTDLKSCFVCGTPLPSDAPRGLCPKCLWAAALEGQTEATREGTLHLIQDRPMPAQSLSLPECGRLFGDYDLLEKIGHGGMGLVFKARQRSLDRVVALKVIQAGPLASTQVVQRFRKEAQAAARLQHPNIVAIHEVGEIDGQHFYSMDLVEGRSLAEIVREHPLSPRQAAAYVKMIAHAIHYAHEHGIVHQDLKPSNILIDANDQPRVADFGLAKWFGVAPSVRVGTDDRAESNSDNAGSNGGAGEGGTPGQLALRGHVLGSPSYMAPEQAQGRDQEVDARADVYALGAILFELVTARPPFKAETPMETLKLVVETEPVPVRLLNPRVPLDLETICLKCLRKDRRSRYATARLLAEELGRFLRGESIQARPISWLQGLWRWCRRHPVRTALSAAVIAVGVLGATGVLWQWRQAEAARQLALAEQERSQRAERGALEELRVSCLAQARANRWSARPGRRFESMAALGKAAAIRPSLELRNEAIDCLALPDVQTLRQWTLRPGYGFDFDFRLERYARADEDGSIRIYRVGDGAELLRLPSGGKPQAIYLQFSPDGRFLAERFLGEITSLFRVWDLERRKVVLQPRVAVQNSVMKFTPDSERIAVIDASGLLHLFQLDGSMESGSFMTVSVPNDVCFDPTTTRLAVCSEANRVVRVFAMDSGMMAREIEHPAGVHGLSWHPQGHLLACAGMDHNVYLWNVLTGTCTAVMTGHTGSVTGLSFNRRGDLMVSTGWDGQCRFWDPVLGLPLLSLPGAFVPRFSPDDSELGFHIPPQAGVWRVATAPECRRLGRVGPIVPGNCAAFNRDGRLLAAATRDGTYVWDLERNREIAQLPTGDSRSVLFHPTDQSLITSGAAGVQRWVVRTDSVADTYEVGSGESLWTSAVEHVCLSGDGQTLVAVHVSRPSADALVLDLERPDKPILLRGHPASTWLAIHPDGHRFASGNWKGEGVRIWDVKTGAPMKDLACGENVSVAFSPDGQWLMTGSPTEYRLWDTHRWQPGGSVPREQAGDKEGAMVFSPDGRTVAVAHYRDTHVKLIRLADLQELATIETGVPLCFSADGRLLATLSEDLRAILIWDLPHIRRQLAAMNLDWDSP